MKVLFSSQTDHWKTPDSVFDKLHSEFNFNFDPCPLNESYENNGLEIDWGTRTFCNPPFSEWQKWVKKGYEEYIRGKTVVFLLAARTDTMAFHDYIIPYAKEIRFIRGRLKFSGSKNSAPFPSMVVIFQ